MPDSVISVNSLSFSYPDGSKALHDISFNVYEGERLGVVGANGAGKSTLLLHLNGILGVGNDIQVLGLNVEKKNLRAIRKSIGLVFQNPDDQLFCPTVYDDVAFGPRNMGLDEDEVARRVEESLVAVNASELKSRGAYHLSYGEKRRVAIASVLAMDAKILAMDEPTASLDPRTRHELLDLLQSLAQTQLIVTHDLDFVRSHCSRLILLAAGGVVREGEPSEILGDEELLKANGLA